MQTIPTGIWTKLEGYEVEVHHQAGCNLNVEVIDGQLVPAPHATTRWLLRPTAGAFGPRWTAPIAGWYMFGSRWMTLPAGGTFGEILFDAMDIEQTA